MKIDISNLWSDRQLAGGLPDKKDYKKNIDGDEVAKAKTEILKPHQHQLYFRKEKRSGKTVTVVAEFYLNKSELEDLHKSLKKSLSTGGTIRNSELEFQGEFEEKLRNLLEKQGFKFKKKG